MAKTVVLINPGNERSRYNIAPPHTIGYIAAYLQKHGVNVVIADETAHQDPFQLIREHKPDIVGITAVTSLVNHAYSILDKCRKMGIQTVIGGVHASAMPNEALEHADFVVVGEGERAMLKIVNDECRERIIKEPYIKNIDEYPMPAWDLYDAEYYVSFQTNPEHPAGDFLDNYPRGSRIGTILGARGCPFDCIFCYNNWSDAGLRFHSVDRVMSEIHHLVNKYGVNCIGFTDDNLFASNKRIREISERILADKLDIIWTGTATVKNVDEDTLKLAKEAGCQTLFIGFESNSEKVLSILKNRKTSVEDNFRAVEICKKVGMDFVGAFILGAPGETKNDIMQTHNFIKDNKIENGGVGILTPFPGTKVWQLAQERGLLPEKIDYDKLGNGLFVSFNDDIPLAELSEYVRIIGKLFTRCRTTISSRVKRSLKNPKLIFRYLTKFPSFIKNNINDAFRKEL